MSTKETMKKLEQIAIAEEAFYLKIFQQVGLNLRIHQFFNLILT